ncbi:carboxymuconolactone decarboxylase family protein [Nocardia jiangxiensis]|uniref:Carboxymuconolactone decarboxylase family protein n=1 Tax=Nocardia jiangxiensis TaxID=282685 RepID=A0ABW6SFY1_9NOCA|nr:carboxymuconolactone decarboxylase family protein [Nocardia jiangxiensis]
MRLPPARPADLTAEQQHLYRAMDAMVEGDEYAGFTVREADGTFVGPWGVMLHFPELAEPLGGFIDLVQKLPGLSERARQVVILTIGARFNVAYEMYAHAGLAARAGLRPDQVAVLCAGGRPADLAEDESLAAAVATALTGAGPVPGPLYDTVVARLGQQVLDAIVFVTIHYLALGALLNAYDVSVPAESSTERK